MAKDAHYKVPRRRRREGKTNYYKRYKLILSRKPRLVVRKTLNQIIVQIVESKPEGDVVIAAAHSPELSKKYGWLAAKDNTPAAYLTGYLAGLRALKKGVKRAVLDIGLHRAVKGARVFAALKGALDAGLEIPHNPKILPSDERIIGDHIAKWASILMEEDPALFERMFSKYLKAGLNPQELTLHFEEVKSKVESSFSTVRGETNVSV
ncbi:MAG: 50S ribosomal protein L18 [Thaumarchaeota archaeon]|nr:MAG: 50S ribosomal protein L18 [Nitrososphaerota archaeon]